MSDEFTKARCMDLVAIPKAVADSMQRQGLSLTDDQYAAFVAQLAGVQVTIQAHGLERASEIYAAKIEAPAEDYLDIPAFLRKGSD